MDFMQIIRIGSLKTIEVLIESKGLPVNCNWQDYQALITTLRLGRVEVAKYLLNKNCRVNKLPLEANDNTTPLHQAILLGDAELVDSLLKKNASIVALDADGNTPLHLAFMHDRREMIDRLFVEIQRISSYIDVENRQGISHAFIAYTRSNEEVVGKYLENGAYLDVKISNGEKSSEATRPLSEVKHLETPITCTKLIVEDDFIESEVMLAEVRKIPDDFYGEDCYEKTWYFHEACLSPNNSSVIKKLIEHGANVNTHIHSDALDYPGYTPLHFAVESGSLENVRLLLRRGASVNRMNYAQMTPLHLALYDEDVPNGSSAIVDVLYRAVKHKCAPLTEDENLLSFFHVAITRNKLRLVQEYLDDDEKYANKRVMPKTPNFPGYAPLHFAVRYGLQTMADSLIRRGANMNQVSGHGTPLDIAEWLGHQGLIRLLKANRVGARTFFFFSDG